MLLPITAKKTNDDVIEIGGCKLTELRNVFKTPLYIIDIETIKKQCNEYLESFNYGDIQSEIIYASKAFCTVAMCQLIKQLGLSIDVSTGGELFIALRSGFEPEKIYFHGNNKSEDEIKFALDYKVGTFIVDNFDELETLNQLAYQRNIKQKIMLRITPGIKAHTHKYIQTGAIESKFGFGLYGGYAHEAVNKALSFENIELIGIHAHIGSQIFNIEVYDKLIDTMISFISEINNKEKITIDKINIGGGLGIKYTSEDKPPTIKQLSEVVYKAIKKYSEKHKVSINKVYLEPGRSIIGNAGVTLYEVGNIKYIPQLKNYIAIDGGISDNIRPVLYQAKYEAWIANRSYYIDSIRDGDVIVNEGYEIKDNNKNNNKNYNNNSEKNSDKNNKEEGSLINYSIVGKHCESGDVIIEDILLPEVKKGDLILVGSTGAYCYSMSSNYNGQPKNAVVAVENGKCWLWVERQSYEDLVSKDKKLYEYEFCKHDSLFDEKNVY